MPNDPTISEVTTISELATSNEPVPKMALNTSPPKASSAVSLSPPVQYRATNLTSSADALTDPVSDEADASAKDTITSLLEAGWYVFGDRTSGRKRLKPGDRICFYTSGVGVVAEAEVASSPERQPPEMKGVVKDLERFPWSFRLKNARFFFEQPIVIDAELRSQLEAFASREVSQSWSWFVQGTRMVSSHDFDILTGRPQSG